MSNFRRITGLWWWQRRSPKQSYASLIDSGGSCPGVSCQHLGLQDSQDFHLLLEIKTVNNKYFVSADTPSWISQWDNATWFRSYSQHSPTLSFSAESSAAEKHFHIQPCLSFYWVFRSRAWGTWCLLKAVNFTIIVDCVYEPSQNNILFFVIIVCYKGHLTSGREPGRSGFMWVLYWERMNAQSSKMFITKIKSWTRSAKQRKQRRKQEIAVIWIGDLCRNPLLTMQHGETAQSWTMMSCWQELNGNQTTQIQTVRQTDWLIGSQTDGQESHRLNPSHPRIFPSTRNSFTA